MSDTLLCDLHTHSNCSDGTNTPEELIDIAISLNLKAVCLCDHNTVVGLERFKNYAKNKGITAVLGTEISTEIFDKEVHVIGMFINEFAKNKITEYLNEVNLKKEQNNIRMVNDLKNAGYNVDYNNVKKYACGGVPNRVHVAKELLSKGYVTSIKHAFDTLLKDGGEFYKRDKKLNTLEVISFLTSLKVVPVLAHPLLSLTVNELEILLPKAKEAGLIGMETNYSEYTLEKVELSIAFSKKYGILKSGGSDYHGENKPHIKMGCGTGDLKVPFSYYEELFNSLNA